MILARIHIQIRIAFLFHVLIWNYRIRILIRIRIRIRFGIRIRIHILIRTLLRILIRILLLLWSLHSDSVSNSDSVYVADEDFHWCTHFESDSLRSYLHPH